MTLVRGSLSASGKIVWRSKSRCGIAFSSEVVIDAWLPAESSGQARVDAIVRDIRNANGTSDTPMGAAPISVEPAKPGARLAELANALATQFASDPLIVERFSIELQGLDLLAQALEASCESAEGERLAGTLAACEEIAAALASRPAAVDTGHLVQNGSGCGVSENHSLTIPIDHGSARF